MEKGSRERIKLKVKTTNIPWQALKFVPVNMTSGLTSGNILSMKHFEIFLNNCDSGDFKDITKNI